MIFVTLGSQKFPFDRLLKAIDGFVDKGEIPNDIFAQIGYSKYVPKNYEYTNFLDRKEFIEKMERCEIVITHGGTGAIINAIKKDKKVIAVPRKKEYGEHVDNHQSQIVDQFQQMELISSCVNVNELVHKLDELQEKEFKKYKSSTDNIIVSIEDYINEIIK